jgi:hypothetical protein
MAKIARDLSLYMQTEVGELSTDPSTGRGVLPCHTSRTRHLAPYRLCVARSRTRQHRSFSLAGEYQRSLALAIGMGSRSEIVR